MILPSPSLCPKFTSATMSATAAPAAPETAFNPSALPFIPVKEDYDDLLAAYNTLAERFKALSDENQMRTIENEELEQENRILQSEKQVLEEKVAELEKKLAIPAPAPAAVEIVHVIGQVEPVVPAIGPVMHKWGDEPEDVPVMRAQTAPLPAPSTAPVDRSQTAPLPAAARSKPAPMKGRHLKEKRDYLFKGDLVQILRKELETAKKDAPCSCGIDCKRPSCDYLHYCNVIKQDNAGNLVFSCLKPAHECKYVHPVCKCKKQSCNAVHLDRPIDQSIAHLYQ